MPVIKAADPSRGARGAIVHFEDIARQADSCLQQARAKAEQILADAQQQAAAVRQAAEREGREAAQKAMDKLIEQHVVRKLESLLPAVKELLSGLDEARQSCLANWERSSLQVACAIAGRIVRGEVSRQPEVPLGLVREALNLAAGAPHLTVRLNPGDHQSLGPQLTHLLAEYSRVTTASVIPDASISPGGCRVETRHGTIDQRLEAQLARIEAELLD